MKRTQGSALLVRDMFEWVYDNRLQFARGRGIQRVKRLAELGVAMHLLLRHSKDRAMRAKARELVEFAWTSLDHGDAIIPHVEQGRDGAVLATTYLGFHPRGLTNRRLERVLVRETRRFTWQDPLLSLYLAAAMDRLGLPCPNRPGAFSTECWESIEASSRPLTYRAGYALVHIVLFLSDFGRKPGAIPSARRSWIADRLPLWLRQVRGENDPDLLAELVWTAHCLRLPCPSPDPWPWLRRMHRAAVRGPAGFGRVYHPTLGALLAAVSCKHAT
jgi:hypothetical protein